MLAVLPALLLLAGPAQGQDCQPMLKLSELDTVLTDAEQAAGRNAELFEAASSYGVASLPCLEAVIEPAQAARLHRMVGLRHLVHGEEDRALWAFAASHRIDPDFTFPADVFPASHPISRTYADAGVLPPMRRDAPWQPDTSAWYDGLQSEQRPGGSATLLQLTSTSGVLMGTHYLWPADEIPTVSEARLAALPPPEPDPPEEPIASGPQPVDASPPPADLTIHSDVQPPWLESSLLAVAGASTAAAGISCLLAGRVAADYRTNDHTLAELDQLKARNNTMVYTAGALGVLAVGAGVGVAFTWR